MVIGESSNPKYYYSYNNSIFTPKIKQLFLNNKVRSFYKVHSPAPQTRTAIPCLISFFSPTSKNMLFDVKNIVELANEAGYTTYWIGAQNGFDMWDKTYGFIAGYANIRATPDRNNNSQFSITFSNDDMLLTPIEFYFKNKKESQVPPAKPGA